MREFLQDRIRLVRELLQNDTPNAAYSDLTLILCTVISACASIRWPGRGFDRNRFVELLVRLSPEDHHATWISVPALINGGHLEESDTPYENGNSTRIFRDEEIDLPYDEARVKYPTVTSQQLKAVSYAALIYSWLRCGYVHGYCPHGTVTEVPASRYDARISYIGRSDGAVIKRMASFHLDYLITVADHHAGELPAAPSPQPADWWYDVP